MPETIAPDYSDTQRRLIEATLATIYAQGIDKATTRRIADGAGVNLQLIQYHFGGKDGLLEAAQDFTRRHFVETIREPVLSAGSLSQAVRAGLAATWQLAQTQPALVQPDLLLQVRRAGIVKGSDAASPSAPALVGELLAAVMEKSGDRLRVPDDRFILMMMSSAAGLLMEYRVSGDAGEIGEAFDLLCDLLDGLIVVG